MKCSKDSFELKPETLKYKCMHNKYHFTGSRTNPTSSKLINTDALRCQSETRVFVGTHTCCEQGNKINDLVNKNNTVFFPFAPRGGSCWTIPAQQNVWCYFEAGVDVHYHGHFSRALLTSGAWGEPEARRCETGLPSDCFGRGIHGTVCLHPDWT